MRNEQPNTAGHKIIDSALSARMIAEGEGRDQFLEVERNTLAQNLQQAASAVAINLVQSWLKQNAGDPETVMDTTIKLTITRIPETIYDRSGVEVKGIIHATHAGE
jgi:hypothetical protein